jgi:hypothetical protein
MDPFQLLANPKIENRKSKIKNQKQNQEEKIIVIQIEECCEVSINGINF